MKKASDNFAVTVEKADKMRREAYLEKRGINPRQQFQLDLAFDLPINVRIIPNDYARCALFTVRNKKEPRQTLQNERLFHLFENVVVIYTGIELRADDDELVWLQIMEYAKGTPMGEPFTFTISQLVADLGWPRNGKYYNKARECISRLKANEILVVNEKAYGKSGAISLIDKYTATNDAAGKPIQFKMWIDPQLMVLFAGNTFTRHTWETYRSLSPVARRLADYTESHKHPNPLKVEAFFAMCGSKNKSLTGWRRSVREACAELEENHIVKDAKLGDDDQIYLCRE